MGQKRMLPSETFAIAICSVDPLSGLTITLISIRANYVSLKTANYCKYPHTAPMERLGRANLGYRHSTPLEYKTLFSM